MADLVITYHGLVGHWCAWGHRAEADTDSQTITYSSTRQICTFRGPTLQVRGVLAPCPSAHELVFKVWLEQG
jgi:hypothetical protein